jgi:riboflavin synthase
MFSGLVEEIGTVQGLTDTADGRRLRIGARQILEGLKIGDSISVSGCCLTATAIGETYFETECTRQTLRVTRLGSLQSGHKVNLERALRLSDRLGGHLVTGHVDSLGKVTEIHQDGFSKVISFELDYQFAPLFVDKGSVAVDGISLTVASIAPSGSSSFWFKVALIPHTMAVTTMSELKVGDTVNIETDLVAKYVARLVDPALQKNLKNAGLSLSFLTEHGYT